jgi:hypothetical protein
MVVADERKPLHKQPNNMWNTTVNADGDEIEDLKQDKTVNFRS